MGGTGSSVRLWSSTNGAPSPAGWYISSLKTTGAISGAATLGGAPYEIAVLWSALTLATRLVSGKETGSTGLIIAALILVRFLVGATHAPTFPVVNTSVVRWFPPGRWALPLGLTSTGLTLGGAAGAILVPLMIAQYGWRTAFLIIAPLGLLVAVLWWRYARDDPRDHPGVNQAEADYIEAGRGDLQAQIEAESGRGATGQPVWLKILKNRDVLLLTLSYSSMNFVFYIVFSWFYYYLVEVRGFSATDAGLIASAQWVAGAIGATLGGWLCDAMCRKFGLRWGCRWPAARSPSPSCRATRPGWPFPWARNAWTWPRPSPTRTTWSSCRTGRSASRWRGTPTR